MTMPLLLSSVKRFLPKKHKMQRTSCSATARLAAVVLLLISVVAIIMCGPEEANDPVFSQPGLRGEVGTYLDLSRMSFPEDDEENPSPSSSDVKVSLVTSLWDKGPHGEFVHPHRREIKAALVANILNPYFDQVVVFLDGITGQSNCFHFRKEMKEFARKIALDLEDDPFSKLTCVGKTSGQPTYFEMFENTLHHKVTGDIVVLSNADQAFDHTISHAQDLDPEHLIVLGTRGFSSKMPLTTKYFYDTLVNTDYMTDLEQQEHEFGEWDKDMCRMTLFSWDTYIFHRRKLMGKLNSADFQRPDENEEMKHFYMNEYGAENAALWALQHSYPFSAVYNACDGISSWSFHLTPKTHHEQKTAWRRGGFVPPPYGGYVVGKSRRPHPLKRIVPPIKAPRPVTTPDLS